MVDVLEIDVDDVAVPVVVLDEVDVDVLGFIFASLRSPISYCMSGILW